MALIFFDLDGTILLNGKIVKGTSEMIDQLHENGHEVAIATGRNPNLIKDINQALNIDHLVLANGSYVLSKGQLISEKYIPFSTVKKMMDKADQMNFDLTIEYIDAYIAYRQDTKASEKFSKHFQLPMASYDASVYPKRPVFAFLVFEDDVVETIKDDFPELQFNQSGGMAYDVNLAGGLKAEGVERLVQHLGYKTEDVYAFGDNYNDINMFKAVGHGIAMGNAVDALKDVSDYVTDDVDKEGIQKALKHYQLL